MDSTAMGRLRWKGVSKRARAAHAQRMSQARWKGVPATERSRQARAAAQARWHRLQPVSDSVSNNSLAKPAPALYTKPMSSKATAKKPKTMAAAATNAVSDRAAAGKKPAPAKKNTRR